MFDCSALYASYSAFVSALAGIGAGEGGAGFDFLEDERLEGFLLGGGCGDLGGQMTRDHDDALFVADQDVARKDRHAGTADRHIDIDRVMDRQANRGRCSGREDREIHAADLGRIAKRAVAHDADRAALHRAGGEDAAAIGCAQIAPAIHHQHLAGSNRFDGLALRMIRILERADDIEIFPRRNAAQGDRLAHEAGGVRIERSDAVQEGIAKSALKELGRNGCGAGARQIFEHLRIDRVHVHPFLCRWRLVCHNAAR